MTFKLKALRGETPNYLSDLFVASHNDTYQLRSNDRKLYLNKPCKHKLYEKYLFIPRSCILE